MFPTYLECPDQTFKRYIESKQDDFDEGTIIPSEQLMQCTLYEYKTMVDKGTWQAPDS